MVFFDETLFAVTPRLFRALHETIGGTDDGPPASAAYLAWGTWIGGDRDGHPGVTADVTRRTMRIQADHLLRGYRNVVTRLQQTIAISDDQAGVPADYRAWVARAARPFADARADLERRFGGQSYRIALGVIGERLERTRARLVGGPRCPPRRVRVSGRAAGRPAAHAGVDAPPRRRTRGGGRAPGPACGRSRRSASTSPRSRFGSTPTSTPPPSRRRAAAPGRRRSWIRRA